MTPSLFTCRLVLFGALILSSGVAVAGASTERLKAARDALNVLRLGVTRCAKYRYGDGLHYHADIRKCVMTYNGPCDPAWPAEEVQCGSEEGGGERGICNEQGRCDCAPGLYLKTYTHSYDYACEERVRLSGSCREDPESCAHGLRCDRRDWLCKCGGGWDAVQKVCYGDDYCQDSAPGAVWNSALNKCVCSIGWPCAPENKSVEMFAPCPKNAALKLQKGSPWPSCVCAEGFVPINEGRACSTRPAYGERCERYNDGGDRYGVNPCVEGNECVYGVCRCSGSKVRDLARDRCVEGVGGPCEADRDECTANTECVGGECRCSAASLRTQPDGRCGLAYDDGCVDAPPGACLYGTACFDGRCTCPDITGQFFDSTAQRCVSFLGARCGGNGSCVDAPGAYCDEVTGRCQCDAGAGLKASQNKMRCYKTLGHGAACDAHHCDAAKGLRCDGATKKCVCVDSSTTYNTSTGFCFAPPGGTCGAFEVPGSCLPLPLPPSPGPGNEERQQRACDYYVILCEHGSRCAQEFGTSGGRMSCQ